MKTKILPVSPPIITSWPWVAGLLTILGAHEETYPWIFSNYVNICCVPDPMVPNMLFINYVPKALHQIKICPWIEYNQVKRGILLRSGIDIKKFIKEALDCDYYLLMVMDQKEFPITPKGKPHETLVYGYDENDDSCYIADFTLSRSGKYTYARVPFNAIIRASTSISDENDYSKGIIMLQFQAKGSFEFDRMWLRRSLVCHLNSDDAYLHYCESYNKQQLLSQGINIYDTLLHTSVDALNNKKPLDVRAFHHKYDHMLMMQKRVQYLIDQRVVQDTSLLDKCESIVKKLDAIRFRTIASNFLGQKNLKIDLPQAILEAKNAEFCFCDELIYKL